jgi:predicted AAA+ superfamily ATPase
METQYIARTLSAELHLSLRQYPVATILGPRQSGKTTFATHECPGFGYANLEEPELRDLAGRDPKAFFQAFPRPLIIDEVQRVPELLSSIQVIVDREGENGQFVLTGSHQLRLGQAISQSLAGRTAILTLFPLSIEELGERTDGESRESLLFRGFLPRVYDQGQEPNRAYRNYFQTYVERDLRSLLLVKDLSKFESFLRLLAGRVGQLFVASALAGELGVSYKTIQEWLSILEVSYIIHRLPPFHENYGKRLVKSPKLYFIEPGLAVYLLGIETPEQLGRDPLFGSLFENMVVLEALKARVHRGKEGSLYFFRDSNGNEVDLVLDRRPEPYPIEIKSAMTYHPEFQRSLERFEVLTGSKEPGCVIYAGDLETSSDTARILNFKHTARLFDKK